MSPLTQPRGLWCNDLNSGDVILRPGNGAILAGTLFWVGHSSDWAWSTVLAENDLSLSLVSVQGVFGGTINVCLSRAGLESRWPSANGGLGASLKSPQSHWEAPFLTFLKRNIDYMKCGYEFLIFLEKSIVTWTVATNFSYISWKKSIVTWTAATNFSYSWKKVLLRELWLLKYCYLNCRQ